MDEINPPKAEEVVFEKDGPYAWHDLAHRIGSSYCRGLQSTARKSIQTHLKYLRLYRYKQYYWRHPIQRTKCLFGHHVWGEAYYGNPVVLTWLSCSYCASNKLGSEEEIVPSREDWERRVRQLTAAYGQTFDERYNLEIQNIKDEHLS